MLGRHYGYKNVRQQGNDVEKVYQIMSFTRGGVIGLAVECHGQNGYVGVEQSNVGEKESLHFI